MFESASPNLWPQVLDLLRLTMTQATFDVCLRGTTAALKKNTLTVTAPSSYTVARLEHRMRPLVERAVRYVAGREYEIKFVAGGRPNG